MKTFKSLMEAHQSSLNTGDDAISEENSEKQKHKIQADPPAVLVMQRKAIRNYGNQKVALYYIKSLNKYVTVPYGQSDWSTPLQAEELKND